MARRPPKRLPTYLEPAELAALLRAAATPRQRLFFLLCARGGLRAFEAAKVRWQDIRWRDGRPTVLRLVGKGNKEALLPLHRSVADALCAVDAKGEAAGYVFPGRRPGRPIAKRTAQYWMAEACARAGIAPAKAHLHSLRHSFATHLLRGGVDLKDVQDLMRHSSIATTSLYLHSNPERLQAAVDALD